jgi:hypothetical protein
MDMAIGVTTPPDMERLSSDQALKVARSDAETAHRDLSSYQITISLENQGCRIDYELKDSAIQGGGPHYLIDSVTGTILEKRYEQ